MEGTKSFGYMSKLSEDGLIETISGVIIISISE